MAKKRKKLNKPLAILLCVTGVLLLMFIAAGVMLTGFIDTVFPPDPTKLARDAVRLLEDDKYAEAIHAYGRAAKVVKGEAKAGYLRDAGDIHMTRFKEDRGLGRAQRGQQFRMALATYREAMRHKPGFVEVQRKIVNIQRRIIDWTRRDKNWPPYIEALDDLLQIAPDDHESMYQRGRAKVYMTATSPDCDAPAVADLTKAIEMAPTNESYRLLLAEFHRHQKRITESEDTYLQGIEAIPDSVVLRVGCAEFYQKEGLKPQALVLLQEAIAKQPENATGYLALAAYYQRQRDLEQATDALVKAVKADPAGYRGVARLALIRLATGDAPGAEKVVLDGVEASEKEAAAVAKKLERLEAQDESALSKDAKDKRRKEINDLAGKLSGYRRGTVVLNHQLCDMLLNRFTGEETKDDELRKQVEAGIEKMRVVSEQSPYVAKTQGRLALIDRDYVRAEQLLRSAYDRMLAVGQFDLRTAQSLIDLYGKLKQAGEARKIIRNFLARNPNNPLAMVALAKMKLDSRDYSGAESMLLRALSYNDKATEEESLLTPKALESALRLQAILKVLTGQTKRFPKDMGVVTSYEAGVVMVRARQFWLEGRRDDALALVTDVAANTKMRYLPAIVQLVQWFRQIDRADKAQEVYKVAKATFKERPDILKQLAFSLEKDPDKRMAYRLELAEKNTTPLGRALQRATVYWMFDKRAEYIRELKVAEAIEPENPAVVEQLFTMALAQPKAAGADKYLEIAVRNNMDKVGGRIHKARLALAREDMDGAIRLLEESLKLRPRHSLAQASLGACYLAQERYGPARQAFQTAHEYDPSNVKALIGMVVVCEREGQMDERAQWVERAYKFRPNDPAIREAYVQLREDREDPKAVIMHREQILASQPGNLKNLAHLGPLYEEVGQVQKAEGVYRELMRRTGSGPQSLRLLARLLRKTGRDAEARRLLSEYAEKAKDKDKVVAYVIWAEHLERAGDYQVARQKLAKAVELTIDATETRAYQAAALFESRRGEWAKAAEYQRQVVKRAGSTPGGVAEKALIAYLIEGKQFETARKRIDAALDNDRKNVEMLTLRGLAFYAEGDFARAKQSLDRALSLPSAPPDALVYRAQVYLAMGEKGLAVEDLKAARRASASAHITIRLVAIYQSMGDYRGAYNSLRTLLSEQPRYSPALSLAIQLCFSRQMWPELAETIRIARQTYPREVSFLLDEAQMLQMTGKGDRAVEVLKAALQVFSDSAQINMKLAQILLENARYDEALATAEKIREHHDLGVRAVALIAHAYHKKGETTKAESEFQAALTKAPEGPVMGFVLGELGLAYESDSGKGAAQLTKWLPLRPECWQLPRMLSDIFLAEDDYDTARKWLKEALSLTKNDQDRFGVLRQLGLVYQQDENPAKAREYYEKALALSANDMITLNNLAWTLALDLNEIDEGLALAERAYRQGPYNAHALDTYAVILHLKGQLEEAERILRRSVSILPMPANRYHLGKLLEDLKRPQEAIREYKAAWELVKDNPASEFYKKIREALKRLGEPPVERTQP